MIIFVKLDIIWELELTKILETVSGLQCSKSKPHNQFRCPSTKDSIFPQLSHTTSLANSIWLLQLGSHTCFSVNINDFNVYNYYYFIKILKILHQDPSVIITSQPSLSFSSPSPSSFPSLEFSFLKSRVNIHSSNIWT